MLDIIIVVVALSFTFGVIKPAVERYRNKKKVIESQAVPGDQVISKKTQSEQKGVEFEKYIVQKFDRKHFTILQWRSDKFSNGYYAKSNNDPDLEFEFKGHEKIKRFAVECKFRQYVYKGGITIAKNDQLIRYREYKDRSQVDVFIALGIGGSPNNPNEIFVLPLEIISSSFMNYEELKPFRKSANSNFFYDFKKEILR